MPGSSQARPGGRRNDEDSDRRDREPGRDQDEKGATVLDLLNPVASLDDFPDLTFTAGAAPFTLGALITGKMKATVDGLDVRLAGITLRLTKPSATALNDAFGTDVFKNKMPVGDVVVDADVR